MVALLVSFSSMCVAYVAFECVADFLRARSKKVGGLTFFSCGRLRVSFCIVKKAPKTSRLARIASAR